MIALSSRTWPDLRIIIRDLGMLVPVVGVMSVISLVVPLVFHETYAFYPLVITATVSFALGAILYFPFRNAGDAKLKHGMIIAAFGWLLIAALGSLPFILVALYAQQHGVASPTLLYFRDPANAFFE